MTEYGRQNLGKRNKKSTVDIRPCTLKRIKLIVLMKCTRPKRRNFAYFYQMATCLLSPSSRMACIPPNPMAM